SSLSVTFHAYWNQGVFQSTSKPSLYIYQIEDASRDYIGLVAATSLADFMEDRVIRHEDVLLEKARVIESSIRRNGVQIKPVLLTYPGSSQILNLLREGIRSGEKRNEGSFENGQTHR